MNIIRYIVLLLLAACSTRQEKNDQTLNISPAPLVPSMIVRSDDSLLARQNGIIYYNHHLFSGTIKTHDEKGKLRITQNFYKGKEEGFLRSYYANGRRATERFYRAGEKDSLNRGWWPDGKRQFEYHFRAGVYEADFKEWYASGKPYKHIYYHLGKEQWGRGWRENGKPYMSFATRDGRIYGSINPNLCYSLKNEKGEYIAVQK